MLYLYNMKILISEQQLKKILNEETAGLDDFLDTLERQYPEIQNFKELIKSFIEESGCQYIEIKDIKMGAFGLALHDKVVISPIVLRLDLNRALYVVLHEIAHQYQYKKYGRDKMYELYTGKLGIDDAVEFLKHTETIADQFSMRKCRELAKMGLIDSKGLVSIGSYSGMPDMAFRSLLVKLRNAVRSNKVTNPERVSEFMYNYIVNKINPMESQEEISEDGDIDERSRSFAFTRRKRLYSEPERKYASHRYRYEDRLEENTNDRKTLNFFDLVSKRIIWITEPYSNGERDKQNWEHDTNVITLWNVEHPEPGQEWVRQAIHFPKNNSVKWWNDVGQFQLSDDKYNQILRSIEIYNKRNEKDKDAKFITCRNCRHKFTQTTHKKKKSLPICPTCGTYNK